MLFRNVDYLGSLGGGMRFVLEAVVAYVHSQTPRKSSYQ
jgi:hypothetical protein